jgi:phage terminase large subunit-like protein
LSAPRNYVEIATRYASDLVLGHIPAARVTQQSAQRFLDDLKRADLDEWEFSLDARLADRVCRFVEKFPAVKGGRGLIHLQDWQVFVLVNLYGWVDSEGLRRFRTAYLEITKKQGKSTLAAPLALYGLCMDDEEGAEVYAAAVDRNQAQIVWGIAKQMAMRTPAFRERFGVQCGAHAISHPSSGSTFQSLSREGKSLEGKNPSTVIVDELHRHQTREVWDILDESRGARSQSLMIAITNSGSDKSSICYEQRSYLQKVLNGYDDPTFFGIIYTIDDEDHERWDQEDVWRKAQPSLGVSVSIAALRRLANKARAMPSARASFMRYQLGIWAEGEHSWMPPWRWDPRANPEITVESMRGMPCMIGLDLASKVDVAAMVASFKVGTGYKWLARFYVPESRVKENASYYGWQKEGWLVATPGETIDFGLIEDDLIEWGKTFDVRFVTYDRFQATQFATRMTDEGLPMVEFQQTVAKMSEPMKEIERLVIAGQLEHNGNPMMDWMMSNVSVKPDRKENIFPRKDRAEDKIDGPVAGIMAQAMWIGDEDGLSDWLSSIGKAS